MPLTDNLISYWDLSEASGDRPDSSGNGNTLTDWHGVTGTTGPGAHNASLFTLASGQSLYHVNDNASLNLGDIAYTFAGWVKLTALTDLGGVATQSGGASTRSWLIYQDIAATPDKFTCWASGNGSAQTFIGCDTYASTVGAITTGVWYFVCFWHDPVANIIGISTNNVGNTTAHTTGLFNSASAWFSLSSAEGFANRYSDCAMALCGTWKRVLSDADKTTLFNSGNGLTYAEMVALESGDPVGSIRPRTTVSIVP